MALEPKIGFSNLKFGISNARPRRALAAPPDLLPADPPTPLTTSKVLEFLWTHIPEFIRIENPWKRAFYENECLNPDFNSLEFEGIKKFTKTSGRGPLANLAFNPYIKNTNE